MRFDKCCSPLPGDPVSGWIMLIVALASLVSGCWTGISHARVRPEQNGRPYGWRPLTYRELEQLESIWEERDCEDISVERARTEEREDGRSAAPEGAPPSVRIVVVHRSGSTWIYGWRGKALLVAKNPRLCRVRNVAGLNRLLESALSRPPRPSRDQ